MAGAARTSATVTRIARRALVGAVETAVLGMVATLSVRTATGGFVGGLGGRGVSLPLLLLVPLVLVLLRVRRVATVAQARGARKVRGRRCAAAFAVALVGGFAR